MKVHVFYPTDDAEHRDVLQAFANGLPDTVHSQWLKLDEYTAKTSPDIAVVFGVFKERVPSSYLRGAVIAAQHVMKKKTLVLEKGYLDRSNYYSAGWYRHYDEDKPNGLNGRADFRNKGMPSDRWNLLTNACDDVKFENLPEEDGILLCGQVPHDASVQYHDHPVWLTDTVREIKKITDRKIYYRPHPMARGVPHILGTEWSVSPLAEDFKRCSACVTYNSNVGVLAALAGLQVFAMDQGSMAWDVAHHDLKYLTKKTAPLDIHQWAYDLCYSQWTLEEMAQGLTWEHLSQNFVEAEAA